MTLLRNIPIKYKLVTIILTVSLLTIGIGFTIVLVLNIRTLKNDIVQNSVVNAKLIGDYSVTALAFQDSLGAKDYLDKLQTIPNIKNGVIYNDRGTVFAAYNRDQESFAPPPPITADSSFTTEGYLHVFQPIVYKGIPYGTIYLRVSMSLLNDRVTSSLITLLFLLTGLIILSTVLAVQLQKIISRPILKLTGVIRRISNEADLSLRVTRQGKDEIGVLYDGFNTMLEQLNTRELERSRAEKEKETLHAQLLQSQKMEAVGKLAGGIAHDFNNFLTILSGYSHILMDRLKVNAPAREYAEKILNAVEQMAALTQQLLALSRKQKLEPKVLNINAVFIDVQKMLGRLLGENIELITDLEPELLQVRADPGQLKQVIMNILVNARDAMPKGGKISIATENVMIENTISMNIPDSRLGRYICLSIMDSGVGIDGKIIDQIFEPFFTTKEAGSGSGIGLSVVYGIIKQHNGWINVHSEPGCGSTFKIYLPAISAKIEEAQETVAPVMDLLGKGERILLVEDEADLRQFATSILRENGYLVSDVASVTDALNCFANEGGNFDLLFSDIVLTDSNGIQLADELTARKPGITVVLSSGYIATESQRVVIKKKGYSFLPKPYTVNDLFGAIKGAIQINRELHRLD